VARALAFLLLLLALPAAAQPVSREEEDRLRANEAERQGIVDLAGTELLGIEPDTFHGPLGRTDRPTLAVVGDLLLLDWTLDLLPFGGAENLDRIRAAVRAERRKQVRDAARSRDELESEVKPSEAERFEAGRTSVPLRDLLAHPEEKPANDAPVPAAGSEPVAGGPGAVVPEPGSENARPAAAKPLDYIPVSPEELRALRDRHKAAGTPNTAWLEEVAADPLAEQEWKERAEKERQSELRRTTTMSVEKRGTFALGEWLYDTFHNKDPVGLGVVVVVLLVLAGGVYMLVAVVRKDD
jgi:hypothetical protein